MRSICCLVIALLMLPTVIYASDQKTGDTMTVEANATQRAVLERRVAAKWEALIRRDFAAAYVFTSPAYREAFSLDVFKRSFGNGRVAWRRVEVVSVDFKDDDAATVGVKIHIVYHDPQSQKSLDMATHDQESWVYTDGQWWYLVKK